MTQLGEMMKMGMVTDFSVACPFHNPKHTHDKVKNNYLAGDATKLGKNLDAGEAASSTVQRPESAPDHLYRQPKKDPDPDKAYSEEQREVYIVAGDENCKYPVAYSAHHLIPAKESLKQAAKLHKFIDKGKGKICCHLGYDVDGNENGVWLPGLHAVNSKGVDVWGAADDSPIDEEDIGASKRVKARAELTDRKTKWNYALLDGPRTAAGASAFSPSNMKWRYVYAAMTKGPKGIRQFHDRHPHYSSKVREHLDNVATILEGLVGVGLPEPTCQKCKDEQVKPPRPPIGLLGFMNGASRWLAGKLEGSTRHADYYTSSWCNPPAGTAPPPLVKKRKSS